MEAITQQCIEAYSKHKNLKLAANDVGIPWQTVYVHLRKANVPITGDKLKYGSETDKLAARAEQRFLRLVPEAQDQNTRQFQSKVDFVVNGMSVDVKASRLHSAGSGQSRRWAFSVKKQEFCADFFVCFAYEQEGDAVSAVLLVPGETARKHSTISLPQAGGRWRDYEVQEADLASFFSDLRQTA